MFMTPQQSPQKQQTNRPKALIIETEPFGLNSDRSFHFLLSEPYVEDAWWCSDDEPNLHYNVIMLFTNHFGEGIEVVYLPASPEGDVINGIALDDFDIDDYEIVIQPPSMQSRLAA